MSINNNNIKINSNYVATQISKEGIDELQSIYLCYNLGLNCALDGPPGVGKTQSVIEISNLLNLKLFTKTCSSRTTESHIISHPVLIEKNGVPVTAHSNGPLCLAMLTPGIFYGDEYNLLKEDVQKRMNSAFDDRRYIDRNDGSKVVAKDGFFAVISYNPSKNIGSRDLEESCADRFVHFHYKEWPSDLKAFISLKKASKNFINSYSDFNISLELRAITKDGYFLILQETNEGKTWIDFFTKKKFEREPDFIYLAHKVKNLNNQDPNNLKGLDTLSEKAFSEIELSRVFARFIELINDLSTTGKSPLLAKIGLEDLNKKEDLELLNVHRCSTRILSAALMIYKYLINKGCKKYLAQSYATSVIINQMCYGSYREMKLKDISNWTLLNNIATSFSLYADNSVYNTNLIRQNIL